MSRFPAGKLLDFFRYFDPDRPEHVRGVKALELSMPAPLLDDRAAWVQEWRSRDHAPREIRLVVPYLSQRDSGIPGQAHRMCFSSSCAMLVETLRPNALTGRDADDQYLRRLMGQGGDTVDAAAQVRTLAYFGIASSFARNLTWADLDHQLEMGIPVPIGILHHGPVSAPSGGGHWICVVGRTADRSAYIVHDPYGDLDLIHGGYPGSADGSYLTYSRTNLGPRWMVDGPATGWGIIARRP